MSKRQLPVTDLANSATLPVEARWSMLERKQDFVPPHSLEPTRRNIAMLLGVTDPLFPDHPRPSKDEIIATFEQTLPKGGKRAQRDREQNLLRARALLDFGETSVARAAIEHHKSFAVAENTYIRTADPLVLEVDGRPCIPSTDFRKSGALTRRGLDFVFSLNFHMIVDYDPAFSDFDLVHLNYWQDKEGAVGITPEFHAGEPVFSYDDLNTMIRETLDIWDAIVAGRRKKSKDEDDGFWFGETA
ncbi:hypothetical protein M3P21_07780 [Ruegeria sp. 2012CJ41-6]|uniref:Uncharacterized protein n=1 Tax=Ruegeria spongiae TaxID=2942209 RepID=A0ABT0Q0W3_9RHOB|nr:hypothetical protein [Ruegeria spongiae]MCL6283432.1 hypothetical protein [Ruegeria spongiae]